MSTPENSSKQNRIKYLENSSTILKCMEDARKKLTDQIVKPSEKVVFEPDSESLSLNARCGFLPGISLKTIEKSFGTKNRKISATCSGGQKYYVYQVPREQNGIIEFLLGIKARKYYQLYIESKNGVVNSYCARIPADA